MFVSISGVDYYGTSLWSTWLPYTWLEMATYTWGQVRGPYGSQVMQSPQPMVRDIVEDRSTADFSILDTAHAYSFQKGQYVEIMDINQDLIYTGFIETATQHRISPDGIVEHAISCTDNHYLCDKRLIAKAFVAPDTIADAVTWIINNILDDEGVSAGTITAPYAIEAISFDYITVSECLDQLANYAGCTWYIDANKLLYFVPRATYAAAWDITETGDVLTDVLAESFEVVSSAPEYRNQQYIRGGNAKTSLQTEIQTGDGEKGAFTVGYGIASVPTISTNVAGAGYKAKTVGIKGVDTGKDWYWSADDPIILQDATGTRLTSADKIKIEYYGLYQVILSSADYVEILDRQALELTTSGIVDNVRDDTLITTQDSGLDEANALLDHYAEVGTKVVYSTYKAGLEAGVLQHITSHIHGIDDDFLITSIEKVPIYYDDNDLTNAKIMYNIEAVSGPVEDYWTKVFLHLSKGGAAGTSIANSTSVVLILRAFSAKIASPDIWGTVVADGTDDSDDADFPCFEIGDEVTYISLWNGDPTAGGTELFRKYRTAQTWAASKIVTTFILASGEANFHWTYLAFYGGDTATDTLGTGTRIYYVADDYTKNSLEALQMVFTATP